MDDKFIMMGIDDERSKKVAEILGNKTCKKIIDYLSETQEASEKDIAEALGIPINTVEYNLMKMVDAGLVEKAKNFFWSVRGKKIGMYKLARKHIVISPRPYKPSLTVLKTILPIIAVLAIAALLIGLLPHYEEKTELNKFSSLSELNDFLKQNTVSTRNYGIMESTTTAGTSKAAGAASADESASDYSETNIQVEGVDEADTVKNDGKYIYSVSQDKVVIVNAYPAENMEILSEIKFNENVIEIFVKDDKLVAFTQAYDNVVYEAKARCMSEGCIVPPYGETRTKVYVYDISDRENPELKEKIEISGDYQNSRRIGGYVYVIANQYVYGEEGILPAITKDGETKVIGADEIYYTDIKDNSFQYTTILSVNIENEKTSERVVLTGTTQNLYVSKDNIYTTYTKYPNWYYSVNEVIQGESSEKTIINKFSIDKNEIEFIGSGEVPGHILNQFSMDEYDDNFRIATTVGEVWNQDKPSQNNVYVLNENMEVIGKLEGLAPGEKIYSVRFMGKRGYMVTFKKIDPLFVIDLSDAENPEVLGKLKIPGYSDYLHPYDENHIIGIGKEATDASEEEVQGRNLDFAWYQGVKMAIFDVSDVNNPVEMHKVVIGDRGTDSEALQNHKAFLFDKEKELLVLPITLAEIRGEKTATNQYGEFVYQGAYVYKINLEEGFELKGRITHYEENEVAEKSGYYFYGDKSVERALYMDDVLYTISNEIIKANNLDDLDEISKIELPYTSYRDYPEGYI